MTETKKELQDTRNEIHKKYAELEELQKKEQKLVRRQIDEKVPNRVATKPGTVSHTFHQHFVKDNYGVSVTVHKYHSGSFELHAKSPNIGGYRVCGKCEETSRFECPSCLEPIPDEPKEKYDSIFIKYDIANSILNFIAQPVEDDGYPRHMMLGRMFSMMQEFHDKYGYPYATEGLDMAPDYKDARYKLMKSENEEYDKAEDIIKVLDAVGDQLYVLIGTALSHGIAPELLWEAFEEIHKSNMSKDVSDGDKPTKGPNYKEPNFNYMVKRFMGVPPLLDPCTCDCHQVDREHCPYEGFYCNKYCYKGDKNE